jgi:hypothetical protein
LGYTWKCHKETPCVAILNKQKYHFFSSTKSETRRAERGFVLGGERTWEGEYSANIVYTLYINGKMISVEIILVGGREG